MRKWISRIKEVYKVDKISDLSLNDASDLSVKLAAAVTGSKGKRGNNLMENQVVELKTTLSVFNFEALREELNEKMKLYKGVVVSENNLILPKDKRAELNNMKKTIEDARKAVKKEVMKWYDAEFEPQCKSLVAIIDEVVKDIDGGIKATEEAKRQEKQALINDTWKALGFTLVKLEQIQGNDWLNKNKNH